MSPDAVSQEGRDDDDEMGLEEDEQLVHSDDDLMELRKQSQEEFLDARMLKGKTSSKKASSQKGKDSV